MIKFDPSVLEKLVADEYANTEAMIVLKDGQTVYEKYYHGCSADHAVHLFSVTKSVFSMLIGIALDKGYLQSVDQKVLDFFPDYAAKRGEKTLQRVTICDLLTMTAPYKYKSAPYTKYFSSESWVKASLDLLGGKGEIGRFRYAPLIGPDILSGILTASTGCSALDFAVRYLFSPLGIDITDKIVFHSKEEQLSIMKGNSKSGWVADPQGINTTGWGLFATPADMAKLGLLYRNRGMWNGKQIVSAGWVDESTAVHSRWSQLAYGYLWWIIDEQEHSFAALGDGGNTIYVNPAQNIIVVIAALFKPNAKDRIALIREYIEPLFTRDSE
ncbi:MAG: serine hydrolase [Eubacteriales bacterium]|nr:serine hydrolase [Eubacteriales bacterium]